MAYKLTESDWVLLRVAREVACNSHTACYGKEFTRAVGWLARRTGDKAVRDACAQLGAESAGDPLGRARDAAFAQDAYAQAIAAGAPDVFCGWANEVTSAMQNEE